MSSRRRQANIRSPASVSTLMISRVLFGPTNGFSPRASAPDTMWNSRPKRVASSCCQLLTRPAGGTIRIRVSSQQESKPRLLQHDVVDSDPLVRQRVDARDFRSEDRIREVPEREPLSL